MNLVVLAATGGTGRLVVEQALAAGHTVTALARSPEKLTLRNPNLHVVAGQATDRSAVSRALDGADALISTLGGTGSVISDSTRAIVDAAPKVGVRRVVVLSFSGRAQSFRSSYALCHGSGHGLDDQRQERRREGAAR